MATMPMMCTDQEVPQADNHKDEPSREDTPEMKAQGMDNALLDAELNGCRVEMVPLDDTVVKILGHMYPLRAWCNA